MFLSKSYQHSKSIGASKGVSIVIEPWTSVTMVMVTMVMVVAIVSMMMMVVAIVSMMMVVVVVISLLQLLKDVFGNWLRGWQGGLILVQQQASFERISTEQLTFG
jgi:glycerol-3-phosphate acyltransferase PlsY